MSTDTNWTWGFLQPSHSFIYPAHSFIFPVFSIIYSTSSFFPPTWKFNHQTIFQPRHKGQRDFIQEDFWRHKRNAEKYRKSEISRSLYWEIGAKVLLSAALAAPPNRGLSLVAAAAGGAAALDVNILISEDRNFIENCELLKKSLEEIKSTFKKLEKESAEARVEITPLDITHLRV